MLKNISKKKIIFTVGALAGFVLIELFLTWTLYNPAVMVPAYRFAVTHGFPIEKVEKKNAGGTYPVVSVRDLERSMIWGPRVSVVGLISDQEKIVDGDTHLNIKDQDGRVLVGEIVPEFPVGAPPLGACVKIWGIPRYDLEHRWWEIHPVIGWEKSDACALK